MISPLVILTVFYCLGIILANLIGFSFWAMIGVGLVIFLATTLLRRKNCIFPALVLFLALFIGAISLKNSRRLPKCHISNFVYYKDDSLYSLSGFIASDPELKDNHLQFAFAAREIQKDKLKWACCGTVLARLDFAPK